jgi:hypothetical protein
MSCQITRVEIFVNSNSTQPDFHKKEKKKEPNPTKIQLETLYWVKSVALMG